MRLLLGGHGRDQADAEEAREERFGGELSASRDPSFLDAIKAARETLFDPRRIHRIGSCSEPLRQQAQFFGAKAVCFAFQNRELRRLD